MKYINKDLYVAYTECPSKYFYFKNNYEQEWELKSVIFKKEGKKVLECAKKMYKDGEEVFGETVEDRLEKTKELIKNGFSTIFNAHFLVEDKYLVQIDIFNKKEDKAWEIIEVKSASSSEMFNFVKSNSKTAVIKSQLRDLAFQSYFMKKLSLTVFPILINVNTRYKKIGELELSKYLTKFNLDKNIKEFEIEVEENIEKILKLKDNPEVMVGSHCKNPHPCIFKNHCWKEISEESIHLIPRISASKRKLFLDNGIKNISDLKENDSMKNELTDDQKSKINSFLRGIIKKDIMKLTIFLNRIQYPVQYLDFETFSPIVPLYENSRPSDNIPFQYSLHIEESKNSDLIHYEFLNTEVKDPRKDFIESLVSNIKDKGSIIVYNRSFEEGVLDQMVEQYPEYSEIVQGIKNRIVDLWTPFKEGYYYHPKMIFSTSLKAVLPALSSLSYEGLNVSYGEEAMYRYEELIALPEGEEKENLKKSFLEYCGLDTYAMYEILNVLRKK